MSEIYGYDAHVSYCDQCSAYDDRVEKITERCEVGVRLLLRELLGADEGGEG